MRNFRRCRNLFYNKGNLRSSPRSALLIGAPLILVENLRREMTLLFAKYPTKQELGTKRECVTLMSCFKLTFCSKWSVCLLWSYRYMQNQQNVKKHVGLSKQRRKVSRSTFCLKLMFCNAHNYYVKFFSVIPWRWDDMSVPKRSLNWNLFKEICRIHGFLENSRHSRRIGKFAEFKAF